MSPSRGWQFFHAWLVPKTHLKFWLCIHIYPCEIKLEYDELVEHNWIWYVLLPNLLALVCVRNSVHVSSSSSFLCFGIYLYCIGQLASYINVIYNPNCKYPALFIILFIICYLCQKLYGCYWVLTLLEFWIFCQYFGKSLEVMKFTCDWKESWINNFMGYLLDILDRFECWVVPSFFHM